jgi:hypothetical protein
MSQGGRATVIDLRDGRHYGIRGTWFGEGLLCKDGLVVVSSDSGETVRIPLEHTRVSDSRLRRPSQGEVQDSGPEPESPHGPASEIPASGFFDDFRRSIRCADGHAPVEMLQLGFEYVGRWHQCPTCLARWFVTDTAVFDEATATRVVGWELERLARQESELAGQARREAQQRASQKARQREEQYGRQLGVLSKSLANLRKAIAASLGCWAVFLVWARLAVHGGIWYFIGGGTAAAAAATGHWWFVVEKWDPAWDAERGPLDSHARRLRIILVVVAFLCAVSLWLLLVSTFGKVPFSVSVALAAGLLYFGFVSPYLARYHLGY